MKKSMIIGIIAIGILLSSFTVQIEGRNTRIKQEHIKEPTILALVPHEPIVITHDGNFSDYGFSGSGTIEEPYIIENFNITTSNDKGITINDTTKFFVIRNCYVDSDYSGIVINNTAEGTTAIIENTCNNNNRSGIDLYYSSGATIANNTCSNNSNGIWLRHSSSATVTKNICNDNSFDGIILSGSSSSATVTKNICNDNGLYGINLYTSSGVTVTNNTCSNNSDGIWLWQSSSATIMNNICNNNERYGIYQSDSFTTTLTENTCKNNDLGISLWSSDYCLLTYNFLQENGEYGISLNAWADNNIIHHNSFIDNNLDGTSQAKDDEINNTWYEEETEEGNYWSEWNSKKPYPIDGDAQATDPYPLNEILERIKYEFVMFIPSIILLVVLHKRLRNKKAKN